MFHFSTGITAINISQFAIDAISHNIANANTPGFHRRQTILQALPEYQVNNRLIGGGVGLSQYRLMRNQMLENSLSGSIGDLASVQQQLRTDNRVESLFGSGPGSLEQLFSRFQSTLNELTLNSGDPTQRRLVLDSAVQMTNQLRSTASGLAQIKSEMGRQIESDVRSLNEKMVELSNLQKQLQVAQPASSGAQLTDRRDALINEIAEMVDVNRNELSQNGFGLVLGGGSLTIGQEPMTVSTKTAPDGTISLMIDQFEMALKPQGGRLAAMLDAHNNSIGEFRDRLNEMATGLIQTFDQAHAQGVGPAGSFDRLVSTRQLESTSLPLQSAGLQLPVTAGELFVTVTDGAGVRRTSRIAYDPAADSLADIASRISSIDGMTASVNPANKTLILRSMGDNKFDFSGLPDTVPDLSGFTGTARPSLSGGYTGETNETLRVELAGSGTIGVTVGLKANVYDSAGGLVAEIDVGKGYEPGQPIEVVNGIRMAFADGTVNAGDSFETNLVANPDTGGLLSGLGLNSFFTGNDATNIGISQRLLDDPNLVASGTTPDSADATNLKRLLQALDAASSSGLSVSQALTSLSVAAGSRVQTAAALEVQFQSIKTGFENERESFSGVDLNEELINMTRFQKSYEAALRVMQSVDQMYDETIRMLG